MEDTLDWQISLAATGQYLGDYEPLIVYFMEKIDTEPIKSLFKHLLVILDVLFFCESSLSLILTALF